MSSANLSKSYLVTGGAGFIGSNLVRFLISLGHRVTVADKLTYAGSMASLAGLNHQKLRFEQIDICDTKSVLDIIYDTVPDGIFHLAAESHVDRSIYGPSDFIKTNIGGTFSMLQSAMEYYEKLPENKKTFFRFLHVSTDEVYGSLGRTGSFTEKTPYAPNSPYSASKASSDHLVRAWHQTYGLPAITTNCSNNYGPRQCPEKLIPLTILCALSGSQLPVYGDGKNVRDWLYVEDHCRALYKVMKDGIPGETYNIGGNCEKENIEIVTEICSVLDTLKPMNDGTKNADRILFVKDRPGHDRRYSVDTSKIKKELGWQPEETFKSGLVKTVRWYLNNPDWLKDMSNKFIP